MSGAPWRDATGNLPIAEYAAIGSLRSVMLDGSTGRCCMPELRRRSVRAAPLAVRGAPFVPPIRPAERDSELPRRPGGDPRRLSPRRRGGTLT